MVSVDFVYASVRRYMVFRALIQEHVVMERVVHASGNVGGVVSLPFALGKPGVRQGILRAPNYALERGCGWCSAHNRAQCLQTQPGGLLELSRG